MPGEAIMLIKKADVNKHLAAKRRKYHTPLAIESAVSAKTFRTFGPPRNVTPAPAEAVVTVSTLMAS
jgi:hypothetical protein